MDRFAAHNQVQGLSLDNLCRRLLHLFGRQMNQQIRYEEYRIVLILADIQFNDGSVLFHHHTVQRKRNGHPLILFHTAVVVCIQISQAAVLVERVLLHINPGAVYMGPQNIHSFRHGFLTDLEHGDGLIHCHAVDFIAFLQLRTAFDHAFQLSVAFRLDGVHDGVDALTLCLAVIQEFSIFPIQRLQFLHLFLVVGFPSYFSFHFRFLSCMLNYALVSQHLAAFGLKPCETGGFAGFSIFPLSSCIE